MGIKEREEQKRSARRNLYAPLQEDPIDLDEIFQVMVESIHDNYVGFPGRERRFMPNEYRTYILSHYRYNTLTFQMLARSLHQFTADMQDRHLRFHCDDWIDYRNAAMKYRVRAQRDCLWVTEAAPETGLVLGDKILSVQSMSPEKIRRLLRGTGFYSAEPERELWGGYLRMAASVEVEHADGSVEIVKLPSFPAEEVEYPIGFRKLSADTTYMKLERMDRTVMDRLLAEHEAEIATCRKLILDLRRCVGGDEDACWDLFPYLVDHETDMNTLLSDEGSYINCTKSNCELRYRILSDCEKTLSDPEQIALVAQERRFYLDNYGKGLCFKPAEPFKDVPICPAESAPEKVVLIMDTFCEDEGEQFAAMAQRCGKKVVTVGRPTMGTLDTFDPITVKLNEHMTLSYPIAMTAAAYEGRGVGGKGLPVDHYIRWTPDEIGEDILLRTALEV